MARDEHPTLDIPPRTSIDDPGAHDLAESESDDHFSDAQSGRSITSGNVSPIPITRVEKIDDEPSYGEVPGTEAYQKREQDAEPDMIAVMTPTRRPEGSSPSTPGGQPIPTTVVEKVDEKPSYGDVPGTLAHKQHAADAVPDLVLRSGSRSRSNSTRSRANSTPGDLPIPITRVERVDSALRHGEVPGTEAYELRKGDAEPDEVAEVEDVPGRHISASHTSEPLTGSASPTLPAPRSPPVILARLNSSSAEGPAEAVLDDYNEEEDGSEGGFGDDFDDFEEGEEDAEFGDFDDGFQEAEAVASPPPQSIPTIPSFPVLDFSNLSSPDQILDATSPYIEALFPPETVETSVLPTPSPSQNPIFLTPRSASLWAQLVAPPPLQPPNWIRSRIRRLFLVSLGVPVDLDEILPASKQKKLILPSIHLTPNNGTSPRTSTDSRSISRLKAGEANASTTSLDSSGNAKPSRSDSRRRKGPPPAPSLDLVYARQLCSTTPEAMNGLTMEELQEHVRKLEAMVGTANEVLEYWTKKTDEMLGDREAFEGVIENLVKHARKTRK